MTLHSLPMRQRCSVSGEASCSRPMRCNVQAMSRHLPMQHVAARGLACASTAPEQQPSPASEQAAAASPSSVVESQFGAPPGLGWMWAPKDGRKGRDGAPSATQTVANLKQDRIKAKKSLGQNFLTDDAILRDIVVASGVKAGDLVLEVGPGTGNLTKHLLERGARVTAVEKDDVLWARLEAEYAQEPNLTLVRGDVLRKGLVTGVIRDMVAQARPEGSSGSDGQSGGASGSGSQAAPRVKVVANLPYNITKDFLIAMLPLGDIVSELSIMIQEEAAVRLCDKKVGRPDYRSMNIRVNFYSVPKYRFLIKKEKYFPAPGVDGALVTFKLLPKSKRAPVGSERGFLALVGKAFLERRKMMRNSVDPMYTPAQVEAALRVCGLRTDARAQDLSLADFVGVHAELKKNAVGEMPSDGIDEDGTEEVEGDG